MAMFAYDHCSLGPNAPTAEERRAEHARQRLRTLERLSRSSVRLPERWSEAAVRRSSALVEGVPEEAAGASSSS